MRIALSCLTTALLACAPNAVSITPDHPASPQAPIGRLAGPPAALRVGAAEAPAEPVPAPTGHEHHQMPTAEPTKEEPKEPAPKAQEPKKPEPKKPEPKKAEPRKAEPKKAEPKKAEPKTPPPPAPDPHQGHDMSGHEHH